MWEKVQETVNFIKEKTNFTPEFGGILGSGLGDFTDDISIEHILPYTEIPNFPISTVQGHKGSLVFGTIEGKKVVAYPLVGYWLDIGKHEDFNKAQIDIKNIKF
jgi:purine-nucleoside phosphorylase